MKIFWSWQSDTPGDIGRFFIRDALRDAIRKLKQQDTVEEPQERERKDALHLDQDRQGVPGSPDLAATIFKKIKETAVFVADVTAVGETPEKLDEDGKAFKKKLMNPNVAIELGYALCQVGDNAVLMVMNTHYGQRTDLPFDLAHKAGPILFTLPPNPDKEKIRSESGVLTARLVEALKPYIELSTVIDKQPKKETFEERAARLNEEVLAEAARKKFLNSHDGVNAAAKELTLLYQITVQKRNGLPFQIQIQNFNVSFDLLTEKLSLSINWRQPYSNTLNDSKLEFILWLGWPPRPGRFPLDEAQRIGSREYTFDRDWAGNVGWRHGLGNPPLLTTDQLSEDCLQYLMDEIHRRSMAAQ